ncbi:MAG: LPXTG cell wall anchor domain-containing protein [Romboutsia sp.]
MEEASVYAFGISTNFVYIVVGVVVISIGAYLYKKSKNKK